MSAVPGINTSSQTQDASSTTSTNSSQSAAPMNSVAQDNTLFLQILMAELKYQNPMSPADPTSYVGQLAQLQTVSELDTLNKSVTTSSEVQGLAQASSLIGHTVKATVNKQDVSGVVKNAGLNNGQVVLTVGNQAVPMQDVTEVIS